MSIGHLGRDRMMHEMNVRYKNITQVQIAEFLKCCEVCQQKKRDAKKGVVLKPMVFNHFNSRVERNVA